MFFIYSIYDVILGEKKITTTLKDSNEINSYTLKIITPARKFLGLPFGGGMVKISRLYDENGNLIHARKYSQELKDQVKAFKKECPIPYFKIWKGFVIVLVVLIFGSIIFGIKNKMQRHRRDNQTTFMITQLTHIQPDQLYGVSFFTDANGNSIDNLPEGWIKIVKIEADTISVQRSKKMVPVEAVFSLEHIMPILPKTNDDWEPVVEKFDYTLLKSQLGQTSNQKSLDLLYVEPDRKKYSGVVLSIKGTLK